MEFKEAALKAMLPYAGDSIPSNILEEILAKTLSFEFPLVFLDKRVSVLELFHGPTMAFKDVGAAFMAGCLGYFSEHSDAKTTVLVATSGDTGGAVAKGFLGVPSVEVVILYPKDKVSDIQERQLTTLGQNIRALQVDGTFDDCQEMVKKAFIDPVLQESLSLTSANSINVARWIPQMLYYLRACQHLGPDIKDVVFSVPSGNFGNICAGMLAAKMGMPCRHFVASTNQNDTVPRYLDTREYQPQNPVPTLSNAMDVADPSNFIRIRELFGDNFTQLSGILSSFSFDDKQTLEGIRELFSRYDYVSDPHGAVGFLGLEKYLEVSGNDRGVFLETAHPIKFRETVESCLGIQLQLPPQIETLFGKEKKYIPVRDYNELKDALLSY